MEKTNTTATLDDLLDATKHLERIACNARNAVNRHIEMETLSETEHHEKIYLLVNAARSVIAFAACLPFGIGSASDPQDNSRRMIGRYALTVCRLANELPALYHQYDERLSAEPSSIEGV